MQCILDDGHEPLPVTAIGILCHKGKGRLEHSIHIISVYIFSDTRVDERLFHRSPRCTHQHIVQHVKGLIQLRIHHGSDHLVVGQVGVILQRFVLCDRVMPVDIHHLRKRLLLRNLRIHLLVFIMTQIFLIHPRQTLFNIHISIEIDIRVGRMVILMIKSKISLIGQLRNMIRITAGILAVCVIRKKRLLNGSLQHLIRRRVRSLHLVVDNTVDGQRGILGFQLIMPALLHKNLFVADNIRMKNRIHVHIHQILKILIIVAGNRIQRLLRICHGIQKCVERSLHQFDKRILDRKLQRTTERRVLNDMWYTGLILRRRAKPDGKHLIVIGI